MDCDFYKELAERFTRLILGKDMLNERIEIKGRVLKPGEAIGTPKRDDFPLLKGKEKLMEAEFKGAKGQAFSDMPENFAGTLREIVSRPLNTNYDRAVLVSSINAVCNFLGLSKNHVHCKNEEPEECAKNLALYLKEEFGSPRIAFIGYQPAMIQELSGKFSIRVVDLDEDNVGSYRYGVLIEDGKKSTEELLNWCDLILATGSTVVNGTIGQFIGEKPTIFYGTTIAGIAELMGLTRFCTEST